MNDLGWNLAWTAVRVSLVLIPASALHAVASRRGPAAGAWVSALGLGLVVAVSLLSLAPRGRASAPVAARVAAASPAVFTPDREGGHKAGPGAVDGGPGWSIARLRGAWGRFEVAATRPAERYRQWGGVLAAVALTGAGVGLLRLAVAAWAVHVCRRRSRPVDDPETVALFDGLRVALDCGRRRVELREARELTTPATAGWRRAVVLLPEDWRSWDGHERRAVLAHELAHVGRADYATGLLARVALALHFYHPLVHRLVSRLQLEQELAADALGARFAGGRALYLQSLSRLALRLDGRSQCWPARAFLPAKGTLIRRIAMLSRDETKVTDRPWPGPRRAPAVLLLLAAAAGALSLHGPALADDRDGPGPDYTLGELTATGEKRTTVEPVDLSYFPEDAQGLVACRPSAIFRREGMGKYRTMLNLLIGRGWSGAAKAFGFDPTKPGQGPLRVEMFEQVTIMLGFTRTGKTKPNGRLWLGNVFTARTTEPVDWLALGRLFKQDLKEVRDGDRVYYKINNSELFGRGGCVFFPDDRTVVFAVEKHMREYLQRKGPASGPALAKGKDWDRLVRGLGVVALDNRDGRLAKVLVDPDSEDDFEELDVMALFDHADFWTFGLENDDEIVFRAVATCPDAAAGESIARAAETLRDKVRIGVEGLEPPKPPHREVEEKGRQMAKDFLKKLTFERDGRSVLVRAAGPGTVADLASLVAAGLFEE